MKAALLVVLLSTALPAKAQIFCSEPLLPACLQVSSTGQDAPGITRCAQDVENYASEVRQYLDCTERKRQELDRSVTDARRQIERMKTTEQRQRLQEPSPTGR